MKRILQAAIGIVLIMTLGFPIPAFAAGLYDGRVVFGDDFTLESGEMITGDLFIVGSSTDLQEGSIVSGSVAMLGGKLDANGVVYGDVMSMGGDVSLGDELVVSGDVILFGSQYERAVGATLNQLYSFDSARPISSLKPERIQLPRIGLDLAPLFDWIGFFLSLLVWAGLGVLTVIFFPKAVERTRQAAVEKPIIAASLGLLTLLVVPLVLVIFIITILLFPLGLVGFLILVLAWFLGIVALGVEAGNRIAAAFKQQWSIGIAAGIGTFTLVLVTNGMEKIVPCIGWIIPLVFGLIGLGAVLMTRFGSQEYSIYSVPNRKTVTTGEDAPDTPESIT